MSILSSHHQQYTTMYRTILLLFLIVAITGCGASPYESYTAIRGIQIWNIIQQAGTKRENFSVSNNHYTSRHFLPLSANSPSNMTRVPDTLWQQLEAVRMAWCAELPIAKQVRREQPTDVDIAFQCNRNANPAFYLPVSALPPALTELMELLPPEPTPRPS